jgi:uncharacterized protein involved in exopolysaccharide biosynthesis
MNHDITSIQLPPSVRRGASPEAVTVRLPSDGDASESFDVRAVIVTLLQSARWILAAGLGVAVVVGAALMNAPSIYTASAQVQLLRPSEAVIGIANVAENTPLIADDVLSETSIIASPRVLQAVAERLDLSRFEEFAPQPSLAGAALRFVRDRITGRASTPAASDPVAEAAAALADVTRVSQIGLSSVVEVSASSTDPARAADIVNAIVDQYLTMTVEDKVAESDAATRWFVERLADLTRQIDIAGADVAVASAAFAAAGGGDSAVITRQIADLSTQRIALRGQADAAASDQVRADVERRIGEIGAKIADLEARLLDQTARSADLRTRTQQLEALQQVHLTFQTRLTEVRERASFQQPNARVVTGATAPAAPVGPKRTALTMLAFLAGAAVASAFALYREWRADGVKTVGQLARLTALPVLAELPRLRGRDTEQQAQEETTHLLAALLSSTNGSLAVDHPGVIIAVMSALPGEGSSRVATRLAGAAATRSRVALLRADPDAPGDKTLPRPSGVDVLKLEELAAPRDPLAATMPALEALANRYDLIVVDAPAILAAAEAGLVARRADAAVLVVQWNSTPKGAIRQALQKLADLGASPSAAALVDVDPNVAAAFGYPGETIARRRLRAIWRRARPRAAGATG